MDIPKKDNYSDVLYLVLVGLIVLIAGGTYAYNARTPNDVLIATYRLAPAITPIEAESAVSSLEKVLADCEDNYLSYRIKYRIGVVYCKANLMEASRSRFVQIANEPNCPELIRACSFNMTGQISRLQREEKEALVAFNQAALFLEKMSSIGGKYNADSLMKLWCSALFSRGEIYELRRDYSESITEYKRLLHVPSQSKNNDVLSQYAPLVSDKISQLYLQMGEVDKYIELAEALTRNYLGYCRTPVVKLEIECVKFLKSVCADIEFVNGSFGLPARVIAYFKRSKDRILFEGIINKLDRLCTEYPNTYGGILLQYHYAWFLDTLGKKNEASEILSSIFSSDTVDTNNKFLRKVIVETIREYARIQCAIIHEERADYTDAMQMLGDLQAHPNKPHISELLRSVSKSIQILKREVPKNENGYK